MSAPTEHDSPEVLGELPAWVPRWVTDPPLSLVQAVELARCGEFTPSEGAARLPRTLWVWAVYMPLLALVAFLLWSFESTSRALAVALVTTGVLTLVNLVPLGDALVPNALTLPGLWAALAGWWAA